MQPDIRDGYWAVFDTVDLGMNPGPMLVEPIDDRIFAFAVKYRQVYPVPMTILLNDRERLTAYLPFSRDYHVRIRLSNFIRSA